MKIILLPSITTTKGADPLAQIAEAKSLGISQIGLFLTALGTEERYELYSRLLEAGIKTPFVHLRNDMDEKELDLLVYKLGAKICNLHPLAERPREYKNFSKYKGIIYLENSFTLPQKEEMKGWAGLCLDYAHLEDARLRGDKNYEGTKDLFPQYPIGIGHISAIKKVPHPDEGGLPEQRYDSHRMTSLSDVDYLKKYKKFFCRIMVMELVNCFEDQLKAIKYIRSF